MYTTVYGDVHSYIRKCTQPDIFIRECTRLYTEMYTGVYGNVHGFIRICTRSGDFIRKCTRLYTEMYTVYTNLYTVR